METVSLDKIGARVSRLGMGCMRLPQKSNEIDYPEAEKMIDRLMEGGVTFYDSAYFYHDGKSESFVKKALVQRYPRDSFMVATKLPINRCKTPADCERIFNEQRENLGVDCIDLWHLHGIGQKGWEEAKAVGAHELQKRLKAEGKIKYIGFSYHDVPENIIQILDEGQWDFVQIQLNYTDWTIQNAKFLYEEVTKRGIALIVMEPVRGGALANPAPSVAKVLKDASPDRSYASWALRWCQSLPGVSIVLSGMSTMEQVNENLSLFSNPELMTDEEYKVIDRAVKELQSIPHIPCTFCKYCIDCPQNINIPWLFREFNDYTRYGSSWGLTVAYLQHTPEEKRIPSCIECGQCEERCPQKIGVIEELKKVHAKAEALAN